MANVISKHIPYAEATAEVTAASVDNCLLVGSKKADMALIMADVGWDAIKGKGKFKEKLPIMTLSILLRSFAVSQKTLPLPKFRIILDN